ncbi:MAG: patatin-like phospholipase family protein, partial [Ruminococcaceae bacterium]|nr:patatin-like phospholipase family protein [Oscillospiraceae bacterium]
MADVGIILSGGMAKGAYQIGVLNALSEYFSQGQIKAISAASVGVLNGYAFAAGKMDAAEA